MGNNKKILIIIVVILLSIAIGVTAMNLFENKDEKNSDLDIYGISEQEEESVEKEEKVRDSKAKIIYNNIPKIYNEAIAPFSEEFKLYAVMDKITSEKEEESEYTFSEEQVDKVLREIFGPEETLDKMQLTEDKIKDSIYYYSNESEKYTVLPVGFEGVYLDQVLKEVTETNNYYYIYAYCMVGEYKYNEESGEIKAVIGDKEGGDLVLSFTDEIDSNTWIREYEDKLPVFKYTLKKHNDSYYITAVEQIN